MTRLVFRVLVGKADDDSPAFELALEEPPLLGRRPEVFTCTGLEPEFLAIADAAPAAGAVKAAGRKLFDAVAANTHLSQFLTTALQVQQPERYPVFVEFTTPGAETLPWEMLCSPSGDFLGLDERWAVGRLIDTLSTLQPVWQITPPLRIAAVLSCLCLLYTSPSPRDRS